jgi:hypothetical protein
MSQLTKRYRRWVPRSVRRKYKNDPSALEAASKVYFNNSDLSTPTETVDDSGQFFAKAPETADEQPELPGAIIKFSHWSVTGAENVEAKVKKDGVEVEVEVLGFPGEVTTKGTDIIMWVGAGTNVVATAWYYADDGSNKDLQIDAFDLRVGNYIDDDFVTAVEPDTPDGTITIRANQEGTVVTDVVRNVVAYPEIHDLRFFFWEPQKMRPEGSIYVNKNYTNGGNAGRVLTAEAGSNGYAWAYYRSPYQHDESKGDWKAKGSIPWWEWRMLSALSSVISAGLGAGTLYLFQAARADFKPWIVPLGALAAAAIGYVLPGVLRRFRRS